MLAPLSEPGYLSDPCIPMLLSTIRGAIPSPTESVGVCLLFIQIPDGVAVSTPRYGPRSVVEET